MHQSYGDGRSGLNRPVEKLDSMTTFNHDAKWMSFRDINNSTVKLEDGIRKQVTDVSPANVNNASQAGMWTAQQSPQSKPNQNQQENPPTQPIIFSQTEKVMKYNRRGASATVSKKQSMQLQNENDPSTAMPSISPSRVPGNSVVDHALLPQSPQRTFKDRPASIDTSDINIGLDRSQSGPKTMARTAITKANNLMKSAEQEGTIDQSSIGASTRISGNRLQQTLKKEPSKDLHDIGVLSGRVPERRGAPFSTIDTSGGPQRRGKLDSQRYTATGSKKLLASPLNKNTITIVGGTAAETFSGETSSTQVRSHVRRRTINGASANTIQPRK